MEMKCSTKKCNILFKCEVEIKSIQRYCLKGDWKSSATSPLLGSLLYLWEMVVLNRDQCPILEQAWLQVFIPIYQDVHHVFNQPVLFFERQMMQSILKGPYTRQPCCVDRRSYLMNHLIDSLYTWDALQYYYSEWKKKLWLEPAYQPIYVRGHVLWLSININMPVHLGKDLGLICRDPVKKKKSMMTILVYFQ